MIVTTCLKCNSENIKEDNFEISNYYFLLGIIVVVVGIFSGFLFVIPGGIMLLFIAALTSNPTMDPGINLKCNDCGIRWNEVGAPFIKRSDEASKELKLERNKLREELQERYDKKPKYKILPDGNKYKIFIKDYINYRHKYNNDIEKDVESDIKDLKFYLNTPKISVARYYPLLYNIVTDDLKLVKEMIIEIPYIFRCGNDRNNSRKSLPTRFVPNHFHTQSPYFVKNGYNIVEYEFNSLKDANEWLDEYKNNKNKKKKEWYAV